MTTKVKPIPDGFHTITPYLIVKGAAEAIEFYKKALNAKEMMRMADPNGKVQHAEIRIGESIIMLADEFPEMDAVSPSTLGGSPVSLHLYVEDVDAMAEQAVKAGVKMIKPVADQFYGDRSCYFADPFGHKWGLATRKENLSDEEIKKRAEQMKI